MPRCRSPPFLPEDQTERGKLMAEEYYPYASWQKVKVSKDIYKVYWRENEKYLERMDRKIACFSFPLWIMMDIL